MVGGAGRCGQIPDPGASRGRGLNTGRGGIYIGPAPETLSSSGGRSNQGSGVRTALLALRAAKDGW